MKIWYQSSAAFGTDAAWKPYEECLLRHLQSVVRPGTEIIVHGTDAAHPAEEKSYYVEYLNAGQWIENAFRAESEGYDAFVSGCMLDPGFSSIREILDIPVVFAAETSFYTACVLANNFSLLAHDLPMMRRVEERITQFGFTTRYIPSVSLDINTLELRDNFSGNPAIIRGLQQIVKNSNARADILIPDCNVLGMFLLNYGIKEIEGIPILDNVGLLVKTAEHLVDLKNIGITRVKGQADARLSKRELLAIHQKITGPPKNP